MALLAVLLSSASARSAPSPWSYTNTVAFTINRLELIDTFDFKFRQPLFAPDGLLRRDTFVALRAGVALNPAYVRPRLMADVAPLSFLVLSASYEPLVYFGDLGSLPTYSSASADYPSSALQLAPKSPGGGVKALVHQLVLAATLRAEVGPLQLMNRTQGMYFALMRPSTERAFYSVDEDILIARRSWVLRNETLVVFVTDFGLRAGLQHNLEVAQYPADSFLTDESPHNPDSPTSRLVRLSHFLSEPSWRKHGCGALLTSCCMAPQDYLEKREPT